MQQMLDGRNAKGGHTTTRLPCALQVRESTGSAAARCRRACQATTLREGCFCWFLKNALSLAMKSLNDRSACLIFRLKPLG